MGFKVCPGSASFAQPTPELVACPDCGAEVEIWSDEATGACLSCGKTVIRQATQSCIDWCRYAQQCLGEEKYRQYGEMRAAMKKPALLDAVAAHFGEERGPAKRARKVVAYAEMLLPNQASADPNVVIAAAALHVVADPQTDQDGAATVDASGQVQALLSNLDYPEPFITEVTAIVLPGDTPDADASVNARIVQDAILLAGSETRRKRMASGELSQDFLNRFLTDGGRRIAVEMRAFMASE